MIESIIVKFQSPYKPIVDSEWLSVCQWPAVLADLLRQANFPLENNPDEREFVTSDTTPAGGARRPGAAAERGVKPGDYVTLTVVDTGTGTDEQTCSGVFEQFFTTKAEAKVLAWGSRALSG